MAIMDRVSITITWVGFATAAAFLPFPPAHGSSAHPRPVPKNVSGIVISGGYTNEFTAPCANGVPVEKCPTGPTLSVRDNKGLVRDIPVSVSVYEHCAGAGSVYPKCVNSEIPPVPTYTSGPGEL